LCTADLYAPDQAESSRGKAEAAGYAVPEGIAVRRSSTDTGEKVLSSGLAC
jgi:hypothetical protein